MHLTLVSAILTWALLPVDSAVAQDSSLTDDSESSQSNLPSLESLKKRSPASRWKSIKSSSKPDFWKAVPATAKQSSEEGNEEQPVFEEPKPMQLDQRRVYTPENTRAESNVDSTFEQPFPVFNLTAEPAREQNTFNIQDKPQTRRAVPNTGLPLIGEPDSSPILSTFNTSSVPAASKFLPPIIRLDPSIRADSHAEETFRLPSQTVQAPNRYEVGAPGDAPTPLQNITEISPFADYVPKGYEMDDRGQIPETKPLHQYHYQERSFDETVFTWEPTNLSYRPLYFEDAPLERYGHTHHPLLQPFVSATRFGVQLVGLPYQMTIDPIYKKRYPLGYYRPGEYAPKKLYQIPFNLDAAIVEGGFLTGMFFLIP